MLYAVSMSKTSSQQLFITSVLFLDFATGHEHDAQFFGTQFSLQKIAEVKLINNSSKKSSICKPNQLSHSISTMKSAATSPIRLSLMLAVGRWQRQREISFNRALIELEMLKWMPIQKCHRNFTDFLNAITIKIKTPERIFTTSIISFQKHRHGEMLH